jgi:hypothetical protein
VPLRQNVLRDITRVLVRIADDRNNPVPARDFVVLEPVVKGFRDAGAEFLDVFDAVDERCDWVFDVDDQDFPVRLAAVVGRYGA